MESERLAIIVLLVLSFLISAYAYPMLPDRVATHWDLAGDVNGRLPAFWGAFFVPLLSAALVLLFFAIPRIDPLQANIEAFKKDYQRLIFVIMLFLSVVHFQSLLWNLGTRVNFNLTMPVLLGGLLIYVGDFLGKSKRNWFIGIRTPWTLSSDAVWERTHRLGGWLFKAVGVLCILSLLLPEGGILMMVALILAAAMAVIVYSYLAYADLMRDEKGKTAFKGR